MDITSISWIFEKDLGKKCLGLQGKMGYKLKVEKSLSWMF